MHLPVASSKMTLNLIVIYYTLRSRLCSKNYLQNIDDITYNKITLETIITPHLIVHEKFSVKKEFFFKISLLPNKSSRRCPDINLTKSIDPFYPPELIKNYRKDRR